MHPHHERHYHRHHHHSYCYRYFLLSSLLFCYQHNFPGAMPRPNFVTFIHCQRACLRDLKNKTKQNKQTNKQNNNKKQKQLQQEAKQQKQQQQQQHNKQQKSQTKRSIIHGTCLHTQKVHGIYLCWPLEVCST